VGGGEISWEVACGISEYLFRGGRGGGKREGGRT